MNSCGCQCRTMARVSNTGVGIPISTSTTMAAAAATGTAECITTQSVHWFASSLFRCTCVTCIVTISAIRARHTTSTADGAYTLARRRCVSNNLKSSCLSLSIAHVPGEIHLYTRVDESDTKKVTDQFYFPLFRLYGALLDSSKLCELCYLTCIGGVYSYFP